MESELDDPLGRTPEEVAAGRARVQADHARILGRDWHEVPKGYYAIPVIDWFEWTDRDCEGDPLTVAYRMFERKVAKRCKTGRVIGKDRCVKGVVWLLPDAVPDRVRHDIKFDDELMVDMHGPGGDLKAIVDRILLDIAYEDTFRAQYGKITGRCGHCRKTLTDPKSKLIGIGPDCRGYR